MPASSPKGLDLQSTGTRTVTGMTADGAPVACTLDAAGAAAQLQGWAALRPMVTALERTADGIRLRFAPAAAAAVAGVAEREAACCTFLMFALSLDAHGSELAITSATAEGVAVAHLLAEQVTTDSSCC